VARPSLHFVESGDRAGPPVILIHGAGGSQRVWPAEARALPGRRVLAVDLPGHGGTGGPGFRSVPDYARALGAFCDELGLGPALVVGHSMGGATALWLALERPDLVAALGLVSTGARLRVAPALLGGFASPSTFPGAVETLAAWALGPGASAALRGDLCQALLATGPEVTHGDFTACDAFDASARLGDLRRPALILCGAEDRLTPRRLSRSLADALPAARLEVIPGAGHMLPLEAPAAVASALDSMLH
jgi:pimeloyl-ACP methyl ester carboxylesterase